MYGTLHRLFLAGRKTKKRKLLTDRPAERQRGLSLGSMVAILLGTAILIQDESYQQMSDEWKTLLILSVIFSSIQLLLIARFPSALRMLQQQQKEQLLRKKEVGRLSCRVT